jgi:hypothetical protein
LAGVTPSEQHPYSVLSQVGFSWVTTRHSFTFFFLPGKLLALDLGGALVPVFIISLSITSTPGFLTDLAGFTVVASFLASLLGLTVLVSSASLVGFLVVVSFLADFLLDGLPIIRAFKQTLINVKNKREKNYFTIDG